MDRRHLIASGFSSFVAGYSIAQEKDVRNIGKLVWCNREGEDSGFSLELSEAFHREDVFLIEVLPKRYSLSANGIPLKITRPLAVRGLGVGAEIFVVQKSGDQPVALMDISSSNFYISNIKIAIFNARKNSVFVKFSKNISNINFENVKIVAEDSTIPTHDISSDKPHGIYLDDSASVVDVVFDKVVFQGLGYGLLSTNNFHGHADRWLFSNCSFNENYLDDLEFNSSDNDKQPWSNIRIINCDFYGRERKYTKYSGFAIGMDSVRNVLVSGNRFYGYSREVLHVEDYITNILICSNIFEGARIGVMIYEKASSNVVVSDNIIRGVLNISEGDSRDISSPDNSTIGIYVANPGALTSSSNVKINNNIVENFHFGIYAPVDRLGIVSNNTISQCQVGVYIPKGRFVRVRDNTIGNCLYGVSGSSTAVGRNTFENCQSVISPISNKLRFFEGFLVKNPKAVRISPGKYVFGFRGIATNPMQGSFSISIDRLQIDFVCDISNNDLTAYGLSGNVSLVRFNKADAPFIGVAVDFSQLKDFSVDGVESSFYLNSGVILA